VEAIRFEDLDLMGVVERVLAGEELERPDGHAILNCPEVGGTARRDPAGARGGLRAPG
jgi:hypothetical protein